MKPPRKIFTTILDIALTIFLVVNFVLNIWQGQFEVAGWIFIVGMMFFMQLLSDRLVDSLWKLVRYDKEIMDKMFTDLQRVADEQAPEKLADGSIRSPIQIRRIF